MSYNDSQRNIQEFFHANGLMNPVIGSSISPVPGTVVRQIQLLACISTSSFAGSSTSSFAGSLISPIEDLHSQPEDEASPEHLNKAAESVQPEDKSLSETDEPTNSYDTTMSTTTTSNLVKPVLS